MSKRMKMRHAQPQVPIDTMVFRLELSRWYMSLTRSIHELCFPEDTAGFGANLELMLVWIGVFIGDAEGRPTTATKIATHCGMSRQTVYRRLEQLINMGKVVREGRCYFVAPGAAPAENGHLPKVLEKLPAAVRPIRTH
jgi:AraC-like DNA-binding protein